jgi:hypothetical protein
MHSTDKPAVATDIVVLTSATVLLWIAVAFSAPLYFAPTQDDGQYLTQVLGLRYFGVVGIPYIDTIQRHFVVLPGYSYLSAYGLSFLNSLGWPLGASTYRVIHLFFVACIPLALLALARLAGLRDWLLRGLIFVAILSLTPFVLDHLALRPEPFGVLLTILAMFALVAGEQQARPARRLLLAGSGAFALGCAATLHPTFVVTSGFIAVCAAIRLLYIGQTAAVVVGFGTFLFPVALMVAWYLRDSPQSVEMLLNNTGNRAPTWSTFGAGISETYRYVTLDHPKRLALPTAAFYALLFATMSLSAVVALGATVAAVFGKGVFRGAPSAIGATRWLAAAFFFAALLNVVVTGSARIQAFVVLSSAASIMISLGLHSSVTNTVAKLPGSLRILALLLATATVLVNPLAHIAKDSLSTLPAYTAADAREAVLSKLGAQDVVLLSDDRFVPAFFDLTEAGIRGDRGAPSAYWIWPPFHGSPMLEQQAVQSLVCLLNDRAANGSVVWVLSEQFGPKVEAQSGALEMSLGHWTEIKIEFVYDEVLYRARNSWALRGTIQSILLGSRGSSQSAVARQAWPALTGDCDGPS